MLYLILMAMKPICFLNQKMKFNEAFNFMIQGEKIRCTSWHKNYFIFINNEQIYDSMNNLFAYDKNIYFDFLDVKYEQQHQSSVCSLVTTYII